MREEIEEYVSEAPESPQLMYAAYGHVLSLIEGLGPASALGALAMAAASHVYGCGRTEEDGRRLLLDAFESSCATLERRERKAS